MSSAVRNSIAAAASAVDGVAVTPYYQQLTKPGQGVIRKSRVEYPNPFGGVVTWQIWVLLPEDISTAERWMDEIGVALKEAVAGEMRVTSVTPQQINNGSQNFPCAVIEGIREEE